MKHLTTVIIALFICAASFAQEGETKADKKAEKQKEQVDTETSKAKETVNKAKDRLVFNFNSGILLNNNDNGFNAKGFQGGFDVYFMYDVVIKKSPISIAPGFGIATENWTHNSQLVFADTFTSFVPFADSVGMKKSKLGLTYIDIPLEIRFRSKPNSKNMSWKLAAGFKIGFLIRSKWKYKGEEYRDIRLDKVGENIAFKEFGIPNMEKIRYGVTARGGYGPFNIHMFYSLSKLFAEGKSIDLQPITIGLSINGL